MWWHFIIDSILHLDISSKIKVSFPVNLISVNNKKELSGFCVLLVSFWKNSTSAMTWFLFVTVLIAPLFYISPCHITYYNSISSARLRNLKKKGEVMQYVTYLFKENAVFLVCSGPKLLLFTCTKVHRIIKSLDDWSWKGL